ncbi:hypothetical protein EZS27_024530, partial [termite gut metagenome]
MTYFYCSFVQNKTMVRYRIKLTKSEVEELSILIN